MNFINLRFFFFFLHFVRTFAILDHCAKRYQTPKTVCYTLVCHKVPGNTVLLVALAPYGIIPYRRYCTSARESAGEPTAVILEDTRTEAAIAYLRWLVLLPPPVPLPPPVLESTLRFSDGALDTDGTNFSSSGSGSSPSSPRSANTSRDPLVPASVELTSLLPKPPPPLELLMADTPDALRHIDALMASTSRASLPAAFYDKQ